MNATTPNVSLPSVLFVIRSLVRDTVRQSLDSRAFWLVLGFSGLCILLCLGVSVEGVTAERPPGEIELYGRDNQPYTGVNKGEGHLSLAFGAIKLRLPRDGRAAVLFLQAMLAKWGAGAVGMLFVLLWTSGFLPEFLQSRAAAVLLAKPVPRWSLLAGKYLGVLAFVALQAAVFVLGTWLALGWRTGYWEWAYLLCAPLLVLEFALLYSVSALLAVWTRSTVLCVFGSVLFWVLCSAVTVGRHAAVARSLEAPPGSSRPAAEGALRAAYWVLPKPADVGLLLDEVLASAKHFQEQPEVQVLRRHHALDLELSVLTSLLFAGVALGFAARRFARMDY